MERSATRGFRTCAGMSPEACYDAGKDEERGKRESEAPHVRASFTWIVNNRIDAVKKPRAKARDSSRFEASLQSRLTRKLNVKH